VRLAFDGENYFFKARALAHLDAQIKPLSDAAVLVSLILLNYENGNGPRDAIFLHPLYDRNAKTNRMSAFNVVSPDGIRHLRAAAAFLAQRYSEPGAPHGRVWNYIVGNEVNSHWWWNNMGRAPAEQVVSDYERAVRFVHDAVRQASLNARVYISLEHHWGIRYPPGAADQAIPGREVIELFARSARERG